jgi:hypothetical protein
MWVGWVRRERRREAGRDERMVGSHPDSTLLMPPPSLLSLPPSLPPLVHDGSCPLHCSGLPLLLAHVRPLSPQAGHEAVLDELLSQGGEGAEGTREGREGGREGVYENDVVCKAGG